MELEKLTPEELVSLAKEQEAKIAALETEAPVKDEKIVALEEAVATHEATIEKLNGVIANAKPAAAKTNVETAGKKDAPVIPVEPVEFNGKQYKFTRSAFRLPGDVKKYTAQEAATDLEEGGIIDRLLSIDGQEILKELE